MFSRQLWMPIATRWVFTIFFCLKTWNYICKCNKQCTAIQMFLHSCRIMSFILLTLIMPNFLNGKIHLPFLALSIIIFRDIKMKTYSWSASSIEPGQTARMCTFGVGRIRVNMTSLLILININKIAFEGVIFIYESVRMIYFIVVTLFLYTIIMHIMFIMPSVFLYKHIDI